MRWRVLYVTLWLGVLVAALITTRPVPWAFAAVGLFIGAIVGAIIVLVVWGFIAPRFERT